MSEDGSAGALGPVEAIRFSRWFGAYPNAAPFTRKTDWIKHDPDRFVLQIPSAYFPNTATTTAKLSTQAPAGLVDAATYEDNATDITLTLNAAGSYLESKPMILVTNQEDADEEKNGNGGINNQLDDPTHIGWMGGTLELEFTDHRKAAFPIAASKKKVVLDSLIVDATGSSTFANVSAAFTKQAKLAREIFAQDLIQLDTPTPKSVPFTGAVYDALFDSSSADDPQGNLFVFSALTDSFGSECAAVLAQCRALFERPQNSIRVLYLPAESYTWFESNFRYKFEDLGALTFDSSQWPSNHPAPVLGADNGTILMNSKAAAANSPVLYGAMGMTTLAHEIGHALGLAHVSENSPQNGTPTPNDPWHRLMLRLPDKTQDPLNNKRFSPAEHSKFFGATPSPHFQSPSVQ